MLRDLITCMFLVAPGAALAQDGSAATSFSACQVCHGGADAAGAIPSIEGRPAEELLSKLQGFGEVENGATIMHRFTVGFSEAELEELARFAASLKGPTE